VLIVTAFYAALTASALGLSFVRGGPISVVAVMISAMWAFQIALYFVIGSEVGDLIGSSINALLIVCIVNIPGARRSVWGRVIVASLIAQLVLYYFDAVRGGSSDLAMNMLYVVQLIALGWSGGRVVLDTVGDWLADVWRSRRYSVAHVREKASTCRNVGSGRYKPIVRLGRGSGL